MPYTKTQDAYRCQDCSWSTHNSKYVIQPADIREIAVRMEPGDIWPDGLCPKCNALVFFEKVEDLGL